LVRPTCEIKLDEKTSRLSLLSNRDQELFEMVQRVDPHPKPRPRFIEPMECQRVARLPEGERWVYEPKQDGYRVIAVIDGSTAVLHSMSGLNYTRKYPHIAEALKWLKLRESVFDGEVVALDKTGKANFQELQNGRFTRLPIVYYLSTCSISTDATCWICRYLNGECNWKNWQLGSPIPCGSTHLSKCPYIGSSSKCVDCNSKALLRNAWTRSMCPARSRMHGASIASIKKTSS
jgi:hypothetical protein